jgi:hypothetical protein
MESAILTIALLLISVESGTDACGTAGFQYAIHEKKTETGWNDRDDAYVEYLGGFISWEYYLGLKGSFIAKVGGSHIFRLSHGWDAPSISMPAVEFTLETNTIQTTDASYDLGLLCTKDFRYRIHLYYINEKKHSWMQLSVVFPDQSSRRIDR